METLQAHVHINRKPTTTTTIPANEPSWRYTPKFQCMAIPTSCYRQTTHPVTITARTIIKARLKKTTNPLQDTAIPPLRMPKITIIVTCTTPHHHKIVSMWATTDSAVITKT